MTDFYVELNLDRSKGIDEINAELNWQESVWVQREAANPEKATAKLALIFQARKVFATDAARREYDRSLAESKEQPVPVDPNAERKQQFQKWCSEAESYLHGKQYDLAKAAADRALSYYDSSTDNDGFFSLMAEIYMENKNYSTALDYINKAIVINPQAAWYYATKAMVLRFQASSLQNSYSYNSSEVERLIQSARDALNQSIVVAQRQNDRHTESGAYGLLAFYYYFVPSPDKSKAEQYAKKSVELGGVWGNAKRVLDDIDQERKKEEQAIAERKRLEEQQKREERARREKIAQEERLRQEQERKKQKINTRYNVSLAVFVIYCIYYVLSVFVDESSLSAIHYFIFLALIGLWSYFSSVTNRGFGHILFLGLVLSSGFIGVFIGIFGTYSFSMFFLSLVGGAIAVLIPYVVGKNHRYYFFE